MNEDTFMMTTTVGRHFLYANVHDHITKCTIGLFTLEDTGTEITVKHNGTPVFSLSGENYPVERSFNLVSADSACMIGAICILVSDNVIFLGARNGRWINISATVARSSEPVFVPIGTAAELNIRLYLSSHLFPPREPFKI